jgi:hypothetical protein
MEAHHPRRQKTHLREQTTRRTSSSQTPSPQEEHQVPKPPLVWWESISDKEEGEPPERRSSLKEPSLTATARLKIETAYTQCNATDTLCLKNMSKTESTPTSHQILGRRVRINLLMRTILTNIKMFSLKILLSNRAQTKWTKIHNVDEIGQNLTLVLRASSLHKCQIISLF